MPHPPILSTAPAGQISAIYEFFSKISKRRSCPILRTFLLRLTETDVMVLSPFLANLYGQLLCPPMCLNYWNA